MCDCIFRYDVWIIPNYGSLSFLSSCVFFCCSLPYVAYTVVSSFSIYKLYRRTKYKYAWFLYGFRFVCHNNYTPENIMRLRLRISRNYNICNSTPIVCTLHMDKTAVNDSDVVNSTLCGWKRSPCNTMTPSSWRIWLNTDGDTVWWRFYNK